MKTHLITAGIVLAAGSMAFAAEQCKVQTAMETLLDGNDALAMVDDVVYGIKQVQEESEGSRTGNDTIVMINTKTGKTEELDIGPAWKYDLKGLATGTGSYIYAMGLLYETEEVEVDSDGYTNIFAVVLKIAKHDGEIEDMVKLMRHFDDGDERDLDEIKLDEGDDRLYVMQTNESEFSKIHVIDTDNMKVLKNASEAMENKIEEIENYSTLEDFAIDDEQGALYGVVYGTLHGVTDGGNLTSVQLDWASKDSPRVSALSYDREENSLLVLDVTQDDVVTASRISLKGKTLSSVGVPDLTSEDIGIDAIFPSSSKNEAFVIGSVYSDSSEGGSDEPFLVTLNLQTGETSEVCE